MFGPIYLKERFFLVLGLAIVTFILSYSYAPFFVAGQMVLVLLTGVTLLEWSLLRLAHSKIQCSRKIQDKLSLGELHTIGYDLVNDSSVHLKFRLIDEFPFQLQKRQTELRGLLPKQEQLRLQEEIRPLHRGAYQFGETHLLIVIPYLSLLERRISFDNITQVSVMPSIIQMKKYQLEVFSKTATLAGIRQVRTIGENDEFEQIRLFQNGDNSKSINWKATSRKNQLMVNQYQDSRSQMVYSIIDKGRSMKMPFDGLTLLDHAINSSLVISNIVLRKYDKAGLITFSDKMGQMLRANASTQQLSLIAQQLYDQRTNFKESNYELLFHTLRSQLRRRSILLLFTNFEHIYDLERNLKYFKAINRKHLVVVIFFSNSELVRVQQMPIQNISNLYLNTFATKTLLEKEQIRDMLQYHGIQTILTEPKRLSIDVINKYLEIKAKRMN